MLTLPRVVHGRQRFGQHTQPLCGLPCLPIRLCQQGQIIGPLQLRSRRPPGRDALARLRNPLRALPLLGQRPAPENGAPRAPEWKPLLGGEGDCGRCPLLRGRSFPAQLMEPGSKGEAKGVRQLLGEGEGFADYPQGLARIAKIPQRLGPKGEAVHPGVIAIQKGVGAMLLGIVEGHALLQVCTGASELSQPYQGIPQHMVGHQQGLHLSYTLGQGQELLSQLACRL